jgi:hypothetical protein
MFRRPSPSSDHSHGETAIQILINITQVYCVGRDMTLLEARLAVESILAIETLTAATDRASRIAVILNIVLVVIGVAGTVLACLA